MDEFVVSQSSLHGILTLKVENEIIIEKYSGGVIGYIQGDRTRRLPLTTLAGVKVDELKIRLEF